MTYEQLMQEPQHLLLKSISGSRAYNLSLPSSDTDIKGIYVLPQHALYGFSQVPQVSSERNDEVFFEIGRFMELLCKNNPNILELLSSPKDCIQFRHPLIDLIHPQDFLSKLCLDTFAGYAKTQIKKARGLNKKIHQDFTEERKTVLDFCYVVIQKKVLPLTTWLNEQSIIQDNCGLSNLDHFKDAYLLFHEPGVSMNGIVSGDKANDVQLSSIPKELPPKTVMHFNKDAYTIYCKDYASWWIWVRERNEERYQNTLTHGKNYDAKNMMHTFRLLSMAEEIALYHKVIVHREDRAFLLKIRSGAFEFEELLSMVEEKMEKMEGLYAISGLRDKPDEGFSEALLVEIRQKFYS